MPGARGARPYNRLLPPDAAHPPDARLPDPAGAAGPFRVSPQPPARPSPGHRPAGRDPAGGLLLRDLVRRRARRRRRAAPARAARCRPRCGRRRGRSGRLRDPAPGHDLAVGEQGDRHRAQLCDGHGASHRARRGVPRRRAQGDVRRVGAVRRTAADATRGRAARPHDRVGDDAGARSGEDVRVAPGQADASDRHARTRPCRPRRGQPGTRPGALRRRDRVPVRRVPRGGSQPDRRRADDVRAGQFRALSPQDLQRELDDGRRGAVDLAVRDDSRDPRGPAARHGRGLRRQCGDPRGRPGQAIRDRAPGRQRPVPRGRAAHPQPAEGRDPQPPDRDLALPGSRHRCRGRDPRRGCDRTRRAPEVRPDRLQRVQSAHPGLRAALGERTRRRRTARAARPGR